MLFFLLLLIFLTVFFWKEKDFKSLSLDEGLLFISDKQPPENVLPPLLLYFPSLKASLVFSIDNTLLDRDSFYN